MSISWDISVVEYAVIISVAVIIILIWFAKRHFSGTHESSAINRKFVREMWAKIEGLMNYSGEMNLKLAIIESDKLLDYVLQAINMPGTTMGERLKVASYKYPKLRQVWWAHKVRNCIVHETQYNLTNGEAKKAVSIFKQALKELRSL